MSKFTLRSLGVLAYNNGFTQWVYCNPTTPLEAIRTAGFFNEAVDLLSAGDHIHVSAADGSTILWVLSSGVQKGVATRPMVIA